MTTPLRAALAAMSLLFAATGSAHAKASYLLGIQGGVDERYYPPCRTVTPAPPPCNMTVPLPWNGTLAIVLDSSADGVYSGTDVLSFVFSTSAGSLTLQSFDYGTISVLDGQVSSLSFETPPVEPDGVFVGEGLNVAFHRDYDTFHLGGDEATGTLAAVPEPASASLMAWALVGACAWMALRRRGSGRTTAA